MFLATYVFFKIYFICRSIAKDRAVIFKNGKAELLANGAKWVSWDLGAEIFLRPRPSEHRKSPFREN